MMNLYEVDAIALEVLNRTSEDLDPRHYYDYKEFLLRKFREINDKPIPDRRNRLFHRARASMQRWRNSERQVSVYRDTISINGEVFVELPERDNDFQDFSDRMYSVFDQINEYDQDNIHPKIRVFYDLVSNVKVIYDDINDDDIKKRYLETVVGAAIFYLPKSVNEQWDGKISIEAFRVLVNDNIVGGTIKVKGITMDHILPRRIGAKKLLNELPENLVQMNECYRNELSVFRYLTPEENKKIVNYEGEYETALLNENIRSFPSGNDRFENLSELRGFVSYFFGNNAREDHFSEEHLNQLFQNFRN